MPEEIQRSGGHELRPQKPGWLRAPAEEDEETRLVGLQHFP